jgi:hypothetical protein
MNTYHAAKHYASALRNFFGNMGSDNVEVYSSDELSDRYGDAPKVIFEMSGIDLYPEGLLTEFGWIDLTKYGLDEDIMNKVHAVPYSSYCMMFYE